MAKGPKIPKAAKTLIVEEALRNRDTPRMMLVERLKTMIAPYVAHMPADETIANLISWAWNHEPSPLDAPWSLGASAQTQYGIPPDANGDLLKVWKWCIVVGRAFTIREAQWVARLRGSVPFENLLRVAAGYAIRERVCELLRKDPQETADIDWDVAFGRFQGGRAFSNWLWTFTAADFTGVISQSRSAQLWEQAERLEEWDGLGRLEREMKADMGLPVRKVVESSLGFDSEPGSELPEHLNVVYALWLREISKGTRWQGMSRKAKKRTARRLREELEMGVKEIMRDEWPIECVWKPSQELLKEVGYEFRFASTQTERREP